ncbi:MAG: topA [Chlamydiales bacterium]|jgi:DNA topoisomerase-1|nr:topA [Chlamydiales bacterium]
MGKSLVIVESPAKIKTLQKLLGPDFVFESSLGHIRDLPAKGFGIDVDNDFEPQYTTLEDKKQVVDKLKKAAKGCDQVYLSPDPDREGEAIAWHISQILPEGTPIQRVAFNAITKEAVLQAINNPRPINQSLVDAQQARRLLDRIVGYKISPILNRKIQRGKSNSVSAGRVQSVALKLVVDREKEIDAFNPVEYWNIIAYFKVEGQDKQIKSFLHAVDHKKVEKEAIPGKEVTLISNEETAKALTAELKAGPHKISRVDKKEKKRHPVPPFITSTLQQEASRHFGFSSSRTMSVAQSLYEGIDLGNEGSEGLITYMRTDSTRISPEAVQEAREFIAAEYGAASLPKEARNYAQSKSAQDAHEAIRPTSLKHSPESIQKHLSREQAQLYSLIWKRFLASQMASAIYDTVSIDIESRERFLLRATGSILKFAGFLAVYEEKKDDEEKDDEERTLPQVSEGQALLLSDLKEEQSFTRPPPRYSEASLVKELEKSGIGRPSTYAAIMNKIQNRDYTVKEQSRLKPTELGKLIAQMLETNFQQIMDIHFTVKMEDALEMIAENKKDWKSLIKDFWHEFIPVVETAEKEAVVPKILTDIDCPKCGNKLQKVWHKNKYFYGCSGYPECSYSAPIEELNFRKEDYLEGFNWEQPCPTCQGEMKVRHGPYGAFLGCLRYPECRGIVQIPKLGETALPEEMPSCPAVGCTGKMVARKSRFGKTFFSCSTFPECDVIVNDLSQLASKYPEHPKTPYVSKKKKGAKKEPAKKATTKKASSKKTAAKKAAPQKPSYLSKPMEAFLGQTEVSRQQAIKLIWDYIKEHQLQDPANKRNIRPDAKLATILSSEQPIDMFAMTRDISRHFKEETSSA